MFHYTKTGWTDRPAIALPNPAARGVDVYLYNVTGSSFAIGQPAMLTYAGTEGTMAQAAAPATSAFAVHVVIARETVATLTIGKFALSGKVQALVEDATTRAVGVFLEVINAGTYLIYDGAARTAVSTACLMEAITADENDGTEVLKNVNLIGEPHTIAAS